MTGLDRFIRRRWRESIGFRLAVWVTGLVVFVAIALYSYQAAIVLGALFVALALGYLQIVAWLIRRSGRALRRRR
jgi:hypothetical protein